MIETLNKACIEEMYLNVIKAIYDKPTANILKGEKLKAFHLRLKQDSITILITFIQHSIRNPSKSNLARERSKRHPNWNGRSKTVIICR